MFATSAAMASPSTKGRSITLATSDSSCAPSKADSGTDGQVSGTYSPPSGARPWVSADPKVTAGAFPRLLMNFMASSDDTGASRLDRDVPVVDGKARGLERGHHGGAHGL